ncbi:MAG: hypothetical protein ACO31I_16895 [Prochlorotrichaceae cyanobacterium]
MLTNYHIADSPRSLCCCNYNPQKRSLSKTIVCHPYTKKRSPLNHNKLEVFGFRTSTQPTARRSH